MRTTLNINDDLLKEAKIAAIRRNSTLTAVIEEGLRNVLQHKPAGSFPAGRSGAWKLPAHIDPNDSQAVIDYMKYVNEDLNLQKAIGPFPSRKGSPTRDFDWNDTSALIEELEGPLAGP